jgi:hypothetical protein
MPERIESLADLQIYLGIDQPSQDEVVWRRNDYASFNEGELTPYVDHVDLCNEYLEVSAV